MKLVFSKSELSKGVNIVSKAIPTRTSMPILECIMIDSTEGQIKFTANDMELGIETIVEGDILEKGKIAIDAKIFLILSVSFLIMILLSRLMIITMH